MDIQTRTPGAESLPIVSILSGAHLILFPRAPLTPILRPRRITSRFSPMKISDPRLPQYVDSSQMCEIPKIRFSSLDARKLHQIGSAKGGARQPHPRLQYVAIDTVNSLVDSVPALGCKRMLLDTGFLQALHRPNLNLNWHGIQSITEDGIITTKGSTRIPITRHFHLISCPQGKNCRLTSLFSRPDSQRWAQGRSTWISLTTNCTRTNIRSRLSVTWAIPFKSTTTRKAGPKPIWGQPSLDSQISS